MSLAVFRYVQTFGLCLMTNLLKYEGTESLQSMLIAIHTFLIIVVGWHPTNAAVGAAIGFTWVFNGS